jgi:hypothetical protein
VEYVKPAQEAGFCELNRDGEAFQERLFTLELVIVTHVLHKRKY